MTTKISSANIQAATLATIGSGPKVQQILVCDQSYNTLDDTAVSLAGGYIKIVGTGFKSGATVTVNRQQATSVTFVDSTELRVQLPAEAAGTYIIYVVNTDGSVALRVNGVTFSSLPTWTTASSLADSDSGSLINLQLLAADAATYALAAGSTLPPGLTLSSSGFLSGTVQVADETLYNFTVVATDAELQDSPRSFSINITIGDPYFNSTTLLLTGSATTFVKDASANNFPLTVVGDAKPSNFNPYLANYSTQFTTKTNYVSVPATTNLTTFTGDFTFEAWINPTDTTVTYWGIWDSRQSGATAQAMIFMLEPLSPAVAGQGRLKYSNGTNYYSTGIVYYNRWSHVALVRSGTTLTFYVNGVAGGTATVSGTQTGTATTNPIWIGTKDTGTAYGTLGYISNLRVVNGSAVYTSNFTPSTAPLTAVTDTVLLACQNNRYIDNSTNAYVLTPSSTTISGFSPFLASVTTDGSGYFDGTGDNLSAPASTQYNFTGDFTIEAWVYPTVITANNTIVAQWFSGTLSFLFKIVSGSRLYFTCYNGVSIVTQGTSTTVNVNQWNHVAATRSGSTVKIFVNGVQDVTTRTVSGALTSSGPLTIGSLDTIEYFTGYINNLRIINGTALYTTNFTPPTTPLTAISGTRLLTLQNNAPATNNQFLDSSSATTLVTRTGNATQGTYSPYSPSGWSNYFDGTGDYLVVSNATAFDQDVNFTVEMWLNISSYPASNDAKVYQPNGAGALAIAISTAGKINIDDQQTGNQIVSALTLSKGVWYHIALVRNGPTTNNVTLYVNGVADTTISYTNWQFSPTQVTIGMRTDTSTGYNGFISNLRVVKGTAVYTANFTPSTTPLTAIAGTSLLTCADNRFVDDSANNFAITRAGDVRVINVSPFKAQSGEYTPAVHSGSMYFDGTGDSVQSASSTTNGLGISDFTMELWFNTTVKLNSTPVLLSNGNFAAGKWQLSERHSSSPTKLSFNLYNASTANGWLLSNSVITNNCWYHVAIVRNGTTFSMYVNGILEDTATSSVSVDTGAQTIYMGQDAGQAGTNYNGYISDFRIVKGQAIYTSNFVPPASPVLPVANTTLLLNGTSAAITDATTKNVLETVGDARISTAVSKFGGSSMYFDGTGDRLALTSTPLLQFGTGDFTIEFWLYSLDSLDRFIFSIGVWGSTAGVGMVQYLGNYAYGSGAAWSSNAGQAITPNVWRHIAITRTEGSLRFFFDGVLKNTSTDSNNLTLNTLSIGSGDIWSNYSGYMQDLRITRGVARYTSNFIPPTSPAKLK